METCLEIHHFETRTKPLEVGFVRLKVYIYSINISSNLMSLSYWLIDVCVFSKTKLIKVAFVTVQSTTCNSSPNTYSRGIKTCWFVCFTRYEAVYNYFWNDSLLVFLSRGSWRELCVECQCVEWQLWCIIKTLKAGDGLDDGRYRIVSEVLSPWSGMCSLYIHY
jgi:hypothetical protein